MATKERYRDGDVKGRPPSRLSDDYVERSGTEGAALARDLLRSIEKKIEFAEADKPGKLPARAPEPKGKRR